MSSKKQEKIKLSVKFFTLTVLDSILGKSDSNERELLKEHIKNVKNLVNLKDLILVIDAGYYSLE